MEQDIFGIIQESNSLSLQQSFELAQYCSVFLRDEEKANDGRKIIIHILDKQLENADFIPNETKEIWADLIEAAGFYPYLEKENFSLSNDSALIRKEFHHSSHIDNIYFHEEQKLLTSILETDKNLIVSAPTSFGKSLLIEDIVASKRFNNIVVIQPTLALLDETRKKLRKYKEDYKIIIRTSQEPSNELRNLYLFTAERVMEYGYFENIDFFIIDEFYKVSAVRGDERADTLNNAFHLLLTKFKSRFYLLGPNIDGVSEGFAKKYNAEFYQTNYSLIDNKIEDLYTDNKIEFDKTSHHSKKGYYEALAYKENLLFELLLKLNRTNEQTLVYCSSPARVRNLSTKFYKFLESKNILGDSQVPLIQWIEQNIDKRWSLSETLKYKIGMHDGTLQKHITTSIIKYFNEGDLQYIFCTSTIIEGVNTSAKNVIIYDNWKAKKNKDNYIDFFDYSNIKGRAGRMMVHYIGKIYDFNIPPAKPKYKFIIDIPFFEQEEKKGHTKPELLIHLDDDEIKDKTTNEYKKINDIIEEEKNIFKKNGVSIHGQQNILKEISDLNRTVTIERSKKVTKTEREVYYSKEYTVKQLLQWDKNIPLKDQLQYILELAWNNLREPKEQSNQMELSKLVQMVWDYSYDKNIFLLIKNDIEYRLKQAKKSNKKIDEIDIVNEAIQGIFQISKHWFSYKVPKWISVVNSLQQYVFEKYGIEAKSYLVFAAQLENDFIRDNLTILSEYGIPKSAINKLKEHIHSDFDENMVIQTVQKYAKRQDSGLMEYEKSVINDVL